MNDPDRRQTSDGFDHDAMFADIVAHWNDAAPEPTTVPKPWDDDATTDELTGGEASDTEPDDERAFDEWPVDERADDERAANGQAANDDAVDDRTADQPPTVHYHWPTDPPAALPTPSTPHPIPAPQAWRAHEVDAEYEEHFEPPPIAPLPVGDLQFWAIIAGMCGGPLLLLYLVLFNRDAGSNWILIAIGMSVGGFALLIKRLPRDHEDNDDGARL